jgi:hypothetical protein
MSSTQDFLREERERLQLKLRETKIILKHAEEEVVKIEERIKYCDELLERIEQETIAVCKERVGSEQIGLTTSDLVRLVLENRGPSTAPELQRGLKELGEVTTINSLYAILNQQMGKILDINEEGKWSIKVKDDSAQHKVVFDPPGGMGELVKPA